MIKQIIDILAMDSWYVEDEDINIAKGKYQYPSNWKELKDIIKRK